MRHLELGIARLNEVMSHDGGDVHTAGKTVSGLGQFALTQELSASLKVGFSAPERNINELN